MFCTSRVFCWFLLASISCFERPFMAISFSSPVNQVLSLISPTQGQWAFPSVVQPHFDGDFPWIFNYENRRAESCVLSVLNLLQCVLGNRAHRNSRRTFSTFSGCGAEYICERYCSIRRVKVTETVCHPEFLRNQATKIDSVSQSLKKLKCVPKIKVPLKKLTLSHEGMSPLKHNFSESESKIYSHLFVKL